MVLCGALLFYSVSFSGGAVWSLLFGSHSYSCWEVYKPLGIVYLLWILIELSCLRPSLQRFVCAKAMGMYVLCLGSICIGLLLRCFEFFDGAYYYWITAAVCIPLAQWVGYRLYGGSRKIEWLSVPLILSIVCMVFMLLFLSFFPPDNVVFR